MARLTMDSPDQFNLTLFTYSGMPVPICEGEDMAECRRTAARLLADRRAEGYPILRQEGLRWEICEPEDAGMVSDQSGILRIAPQKVTAWECRECGEVLPSGDSCNCLELCEEEETEEETEEEESVECPECTQTMVYSHPGTMQGAWFSCPNPECKRTVPLLVL